MLITSKPSMSTNPPNQYGQFKRTNETTNIFEGVGFHQYLNFGKFKPPKGESRTFYDLANMGEYQYLKWLLSQRTSKRAKTKVRDNCFPHIEAALQNENGQSKWEKRTIVENERLYTIYVALNQGGYEVESPKIEMRQCKGCQRIKGAYVFTKNSLVCDVCFKSTQFPYPQEQQPSPNVLQDDVDVKADKEEYDTNLRRSKLLKQYKGFWHSDLHQT